MAIRIDTGRMFKIVLNDGICYTLSLSKDVADSAAKGLVEGGTMTFYDNTGWVSLCLDSSDIKYIVRDDLC